MLTCHFDGAISINPNGTAAYGAVVKERDDIIFSDCRLTEGTTSNVAEYAGLEAVLRFLLENEKQNEKILILGDSMLVIQQMTNLWRIKKGAYKEKALICKTLLENFTDMELQWIPREENSEADELSKAPLRYRGLSDNREFLHESADSLLDAQFKQRCETDRETTPKDWRH